MSREAVVAFHPTYPRFPTGAVKATLDVNPHGSNIGYGNTSEMWK
jgi:hypothetical protein